VLGCGYGRRVDPATSPNVVLVVIDTARADHFGCYGYSIPTTPSIDAFSNDAVLYRHARSPAPWTLPAHASMFTGLWPTEHGLHFAPRGRPNQPSATVSFLRKPAQRRLLAARLAARGYTTFGVSNNSWVSEHTGLDEGFDDFFYVPPTQLGPQALRERLGTEALPATLAAGSVSLLRAGLDAGEIRRPFFAFFNLIEPHFPYLPAESHAGRFGGDPRALRQLMGGNQPQFEFVMMAGGAHPDPSLLTPLYDEELASVDAALEELFTFLRERDLYDDALIIVTADHGEHLGEGSRYSHQLSMDDALLSVPLIIKYPRAAGARGIVDEPLISTIDIYQTVLAAALPDDPPARETSQDLARMDRFRRRFTLSEYHYSPAYLKQLEDAAESFDAAPHKVVRRLIVTSEAKLEIASNDHPSAIASLPAPVRDEVAAYLARVSTLEEGEAAALTPEAIEDLRTLGYLE
jgi:arylsulfatase A-like enzyme